MHVYVSFILIRGQGCVCIFYKIYEENRIGSNTYRVITDRTFVIEIRFCIRKKRERRSEGESEKKERKQVNNSAANKNDEWRRIANERVCV